MAASGPAPLAGLEPSPFPGTLVGELRLHVGSRAGKDIAVRQYHQGALRVLRPHYLDDTAQVCYTIVNPGGGYLGADEYGIEIRVAEGSSLLLTTQSATKVYRTPQGPARQDMLITLGSGAVLEYLPDQLIAYKDASYFQRTVVHMAADASLVLCEVLTPGWSPDGSRFSYEQLRLRTEVHLDGRLGALDNLWVKPGEDTIDSLLYLQDSTHVGMLLAIDPRIDAAMATRLRELAYEIAGQQPDDMTVGISQTPVPGVAVRTLGGSTESANAVLYAIVNQLRIELRGQQPVNLRKY